MTRPNWPNPWRHSLLSLVSETAGFTRFPQYYQLLDRQALRVMPWRHSGCQNVAGAGLRACGRGQSPILCRGAGLGRG